MINEAAWPPAVSTATLGGRGLSRCSETHFRMGRLGLDTQGCRGSWAAGLASQPLGSGFLPLPHPPARALGAQSPEPGTLCRAVTPFQPWAQRLLLAPQRGVGVSARTSSKTLQSWVTALSPHPFGPCVPSTGTGQPEWIWLRDGEADGQGGG